MNTTDTIRLDLVEACNVLVDGLTGLLDGRECFCQTKGRGVPVDHTKACLAVQNALVRCDQILERVVDTLAGQHGR